MQFVGGMSMLCRISKILFLIRNFYHYHFLLTREGMFHFCGSAVMHGTVMQQNCIVCVCVHG
jgi:hypothetical protein